MKNILRLCALLGALAVVLGAFGAHGLKSLVTPDRIEIFTTGVRYHFYHVFAIGLAAALWRVKGMRRSQLKRAAYCWAAGIVLFSGSLYLLSLQDILPLPTSLLGPVTPVGGLFFVAGWILLFLAPEHVATNDKPT